MLPPESVQQIVSLAEQLEGKRPFFIAIDGHSAAGKSTLAQKLAVRLGETAVVFMDDFYRPMNEDERFRLNAEQGAELYYDWQRLRTDVLHPLYALQTASFQLYDWERNQLNEWKHVEPNRFVIVEGCYSARLELCAFFDFVIFVDTSPSERQARQAARADAPQSWLDRWEAAEQFHIVASKLQDRADLVLSGSAVRSTT